MEVRLLDSRTDAAKASEATVALVGWIGDRAFGQRAIEQLDRLIRLNWWTVYRMFDAAPPELHVGGHLRADDVVADSFGAYRNGLWRDDQVFALARERARGGGSIMTHQQAREMKARHRSRIYTRHKLAERLSLVRAERNGGTLAVNLYRHVESKPFSDADRDRLDDAAPVILACVARHIALREGALAAKAGDDGPAAPAPPPPPPHRLARRSARREGRRRRTGGRGLPCRPAAARARGVRAAAARLDPRRRRRRSVHRRDHGQDLPRPRLRAPRHPPPQRAV